MLLDLNKLHGPREHVERTMQPSALGPDDPDYRVAAPVELSMDVAKVGADVFEATGRVQDTARAGVQPLSRAVRGAGRCDVRAAVRAAVRRGRRGERPSARSRKTT